MIVLSNNLHGNNKRVADLIASRFRCEVVAASINPDLAGFDQIVLVIPNVGDEELPQEMEDYLFSLTDRDKEYFICELGNYFGLSYVGCRRVAIDILSKLGWKLIGQVAVDSFPTLDTDQLDRWLDSGLENLSPID